MIMDMHACETCGLQHAHPGDLPSAPESDEVKIARIQADKEVKVEQLRARQDKDWNETRVEVAAIEAEAEVASAEATAEVIGEVIAAEAETGTGETPPAEPEEIVETGEPEPDAAPPPETESAPKEPAKKSLWTFG